MVIGKVINKFIQALPSWEVTKYYGRVCIFQLKCLKYRVQTSEAWFNLKCKFLPSSLRDESECEELPQEQQQKKIQSKNKQSPCKTQRGSQQSQETKKTKSKTRMHTVKHPQDERQQYNANQQSYKRTQLEVQPCKREQQQQASDKQLKGKEEDCNYRGCAKHVEPKCRHECEPKSKHKKREVSPCRTQQQAQEGGNVICTQPRSRDKHSKKLKKKSKSRSQGSEKKLKKAKRS